MRRAAGVSRASDSCAATASAKSGANAAAARRARDSRAAAKNENNHGVKRGKCAARKKSGPSRAAVIATARRAIPGAASGAHAQQARIPALPAAVDLSGGSRPHHTTSWPPRRKVSATAAPTTPPPTTAIFFGGESALI